MAHLWIADGGDPAWAVLELDAGAYDLTSWPPARLRGPDASSVRDAAPAVAGSTVTLRASGDAETAQWVILAAAGAQVAVNGLPLVAGVRVLQDRDELRIGPHGAYFSTERLARVEPFGGSDRPLSCPRCMNPIVVADGKPVLVVRCPGCGVQYHEVPELPCWTHAKACGLCSHPTRLDAGYQWTPEES